jgi:hypothetical protein
MKYRKMGSLPWEVSALGFGCMRLPTSGLLHRVDEKYAIEILRNGIDRGINYVDTAWFYHLGQSEQVLGKALKNGYREKVHLARKTVLLTSLPRSTDARSLSPALPATTACPVPTGLISPRILHCSTTSRWDRRGNSQAGSFNGWSCATIAVLLKLKRSSKQKNQRQSHALHAM